MAQLRVAGGLDEEFVRALYAEHGRALLGYARSLTSDADQAQDIVQETLLRAWKHHDKLTCDDRPIRPWLFTVARNLVVDQWRAQHAVPVDIDELSQLPADDELDRIVDTWHVRDAVRTLSPEHRAALIETYYRGHTVQEAARVLGVPPGTVKSRVFYALRGLRLKLEERGLTP